ncbi:hypothetical protein P5673_026812 [Acropora cervicornis]|uniref:Uncharacterized protein n=1 Tax=Acropora cervicornis TaxID=6130 RepID=A0AAD9PZP5_ACRCE|nr:hypothetical protein P5673_026812 [Acropora cervicornis]
MGGPLRLQGNVRERRMRAYGQLLNTELLQEARKNLEKIQKGNVDSGPLTAKDVYTKAWEEKKPNKQMSTIIKSLKDEGRKLELLWKATTKGLSIWKKRRHLDQQHFRDLVPMIRCRV